MTISDRVLAFLKEQPGSAQEIGEALGLSKRKWGYAYNWGKWRFDEAEAKGLIEYGEDYKWHLKEAEEDKLKPSCYGGFGSETCIIVGCVFQDSCEIEETESFKKAQEAEGLGDKCPECGGPATHPSGLCRDCHQAKLETHDSMFLRRVSKFNKMRQGMCPNQCGSLTILKRRQAIMYMIPMELIEDLENQSEEMCGYIAGVCPECGFILITDNKEAEI